jgi:putative transposase
MKLSYKYEINPNAAQRAALGAQFHFCKDLYNSALEERISYYKRNKNNEVKKSLTYKDQSAELVEMKGKIKDPITGKNIKGSNIIDGIDNIYSQALQQVLKQVDVAYANFFRRVKNKEEKVGFPRFKSHLRFKSICFPQVDKDLSSVGGIRILKNNSIKIFKIPGYVKVIWHRPFEGRCAQIRICRDGDKYFLVLSCKDIPRKVLPVTGNTIGIDLGISSFITTDSGERISHPRAYRSAKETLAEKNRKLALKQRGSLNRRKALSALQKAHRKVVNVRKDFQHKIANKLIRENDVIILEKLNIRKMLQQDNPAVQKSNISDASWGNFVAMLIYKAESAGRSIIKVNPARTSSTCSRCNKIKKDLDLSIRTYRCEFCKLEMDRDHNAAINIKRLGTSLVTQL